MEIIKNALVIKGKILFNEPLSGHTTFRIGGPCEIWAEPRNEFELSKILRFAKENRKKVFVVGGGSNILFKDKGFKGMVIHLGNDYFKKVNFSGTEVTSGAGIMMGRLIELACGKGLGGIEGLAGIPGTLGGAIFMNSGYIQEIRGTVRSVKVMDTSGAMKRIKRKKIKFGYRHSDLDGYIILEATLRLKRAKKNILLKRKSDFMKEKKIKQPLGSLSAGCVFKNPPGEIGAGRYIDMAGLKGKIIGGAKISNKHANFIINTKNANAKDVTNLINTIKKRVKSRFNVELVPEIVVV